MGSDRGFVEKSVMGGLDWEEKVWSSVGLVRDARRACFRGAE